MDLRKKHCSFKSLSREEILNAFEKTKLVTDFSNIGDLVLVTPEYFDQIFELARSSFSKDEPINKALGLGWDKDKEAFWLAKLQQHISLALINKENGDVIAFRLFLFEFRDDKEITRCQPVGNHRIIRGFLDYLDKKADIYNYYGVNEICHFFALCVDEKYRNRGLGSKLIDATVIFLSNLDIHPLVLKAEGTSKFSQNIFQKLGFETITEVPYDEYIVDGQKVLTNTGEHRSAKVYGKVIA